jgi:hypothetical protein
MARFDVQENHDQRKVAFAQHFFWSSFSFVSRRRVKRKDWVEVPARAFMLMGR